MLWDGVRVFNRSGGCFSLLAACFGLLMATLLLGSAASLFTSAGSSSSKAEKAVASQKSKESDSEKAVSGEQATKKYKLDVSVECTKNFLFSRYDVNVSIDGKQVGAMDHGTTKSFQVDLSEGKHTFKVEKKGEPDVDGSADFDMSAEESVLACKLYCNSDQIEIEDFSAKTKKQAAADEEAARVAAEEAAAKKAAEEEAAEKKKAEEKAAREQKEAEERAARKAEEERIAAGSVSEVTAELLVADYGDQVYSYGFKLHYFTGVLAADRQADGSMFLKIYCDVRNAYGTWAKNLVCEAYVGGTEGDPKILSFNVY